MKVAVSVMDKSLDTEVNPRFGRAAWFMVYDSENDTASFEDNEQNYSAAQGAGIQSGQTVARLGVQAVLTGHCGPKAFRTLSAAGIDVVTGVSGPARAAIDRYLAGELKAAGQADVEGHW